MISDLGGARGADFAVVMKRALAADRRDDDRAIVFDPQNVGRHVDLAHVDEPARAQHEFLEILAIAAQRDFVVDAGGHVAEMRGRDVLAADRLEIEDVDCFLRRLDQIVRAHRPPHQRVRKLGARHRPFAGKCFKPTSGEQRASRQKLQKFAAVGGLIGERCHGGTLLPSDAAARCALFRLVSARQTVHPTRPNSRNNRVDRSAYSSEARSMPSIAEKRAAFRKLHATGCFVIPNPWNVGSALYLQGLGFKALATTSSGFAHAQGYADGAVDLTLDTVLAHFQEIADAADVPLNADFEDGLADDLDGLAKNVTRCVETGVSGLSIEDSPNNGRTPLYDLDIAVTRVKAARAAIDRAGGDVMLTGRAENFIRGVNDLDDAIRRLKAYAAAGADCLYAPGIKTREQIEAVVKAVAPKPVNFLNSGAFGFTVSDLARMGVRRISVGGSLARVAVHAFIRVATEIG